MNAHVSVIILNWRNTPDTLQTVASCKQLDYPSFDIVVVDNDSQDGSEERIRSVHPDITVLQAGANLGYAGGNNAGIRHALQSGAAFVLILNNDVTLLPTALSELVGVLLDQPRCALATPMIAHMDAQDTIWTCGARLDSRNGDVHRLHAGCAVGEIQKHSPFEVDVAAGAAMLVPVEALAKYGLMDEGFFLYYEEADWCLRIVRGGGRVVAVPSAVVYHQVSATLGTESPMIDYYMLRNQIRFITRNWDGPTRASMLAWVVLRGLRSIAAYTLKPSHGERIPHRDARAFALRDALRKHWGKMGADVAAVCARHNSSDIGRIRPVSGEHIE